MTKRTRNRAGRAARSIAGLYAVVALAWIWWSDAVLIALGEPAEQLIRRSQQKGSIFVIVTAAMLYALVDRYMRHLAASEAHAREAKERLERMVENSPQGVVYFDRGGRMTYANRSAAEMLGSSEESLLREHAEHLPFETYYPDGRPMRREEHPIARALLGEVVSNARVVALIAEQRRHFESSAAPLLDEDSRIVGAVVTFIDVTERVLAQDRIQASEERYRRIIETAQEGVWVVDAEGVTTLVNNRMCEILGYDESEMLGRPLVDFLPEHNQTRFLEWFAKVGSHPAGRRMDARCRRKDGSEAWAIVSVSPIVEDGELVGVLGMHTDITERKRMEAALWETSEMLQAVVASAPVPVIALDDGGRVVVWNRAAEQVFGWSEAECLGELPPYVDEEAIPELDDLRTRILAGDVVAGRVVTRFRRDGKRLRLRLHAASLMSADGASMGVLSMLEDITERECEQEELRAYREGLEDLVAARTAELRQLNDELLAATRAKGTFLANVSHELRTPLNSIIGFSGLLLKEASGPLVEEQRKQLGLVQGSARHLLELINGILDLSKIEAGKVVVQATSFDAADAVESVAALLRPQADEKGLEFVVDVEGPVPMDTDRTKLEQVLLNLAGNAVKFTESGEVRLRLRADEDGFARFSVTDTGVGIAEHEMSTVFEQFKQAAMPGLVKPTGTGLGLSISAQYAELLGGRIEARSTPSVGSTFTLVLPVVYAPLEERNAS